jgi:hypothetical protein
MQTKTKAEQQENEGGNVHFLQPLKEIPDPNVPLLKEGRGVYEQWCRTLIKSGMLTLKSREYVELLAIATDDIAFTINKGKRPTRQAMEAKRAAMMKLEKLDANQTIASPGGNSQVYAAFGFAKRARAAKHPKN